MASVAVPFRFEADPLKPDERPWLPSREDLWFEEGGLSLVELQKSSNQHFETLCRVHFHLSLVRLFDKVPGLEGVVLRRVEEGNFFPLKSFVDKILPAPTPEGERALKKTTALLSQLRGGLPKDNHMAACILRGIPLGWSFFLTRETAATYLAQVHEGEWLVSKYQAQSLAGSMVPSSDPAKPVKARF